MRLKQTNQLVNNLNKFIPRSHFPFLNSLHFWIKKSDVAGMGGGSATCVRNTSAWGSDLQFDRERIVSVLVLQRRHSQSLGPEKPAGQGAHQGTGRILEGLLRQWVPVYGRRSRNSETNFWTDGTAGRFRLFQLTIFKGRRRVGEEFICDPIKDMAVCNNRVFTVRDVDLVITEFHKCKSNEKIECLVEDDDDTFYCECPKHHTEAERFKPVSLKTIMGRAPVTLFGDKFAFTSRSGRDIIVHENSKDTQFNLIADVKVRANIYSEQINRSIFYLHRILPNAR